MRIGEMAKNYNAQASANKGEIYGMNKRTNSDRLAGMCVHGVSSANLKTVQVPDEIKDKLLSLAQSEFLNNFGMTDGEERSALIKKYVAGVPESERLNTTWTLGQIFHNESVRLNEIAKANVPGWQEGQPFDRDAISKLISNSLDVKA